MCAARSRPAVLPGLSLVDGRSDRSGAVTARRRERILEQAVDIFARRGYEGASTREIAEAAGLRQGHLYYYFAAKEDLLFAVVDELHDRFLDGLGRWTEPVPATPDAALRCLWEVLRRHVLLVCERREQTMVAYESLRFLGADRRALITVKRDRYESALGSLIAASDTDRSSPDVTTKAVLGALNWVYQWYSPTGPTTAEDLAEQLAGAALTLVANAPTQH
jgi:AcrR family transcriptional regulator